MKTFLITISLLIVVFSSFGQNQNVSNGTVFDGEPYLSISPINSQHMVVVWMGYLPFSNIILKSKVSFDAGQTWSAVKNIPHANPVYGSADPAIEFDNSGNVFLSYVDYNKSIDSGAVYLIKSIDGGLNWGSPVEVIHAHSDIGKYPVDRPWMSIDRTNGVNEGNIYITSMSPKIFGLLAPPYHPYFMVSTDGGNSFNPWQYLDTTNWLSGNLIQQPMPTHCVSSSGIFHAIYPSYLLSQSPYVKYIIASSSDAGNSFTYNTVLNSTHGLSDALPKKGYLLRSNPANANHLAFFYLNTTHGDLDVFMRESFDEGASWSSETRINDDPTANNRMQDLLWADFDTDGDLVVSWRDRRNSQDSTYTTSSEIWAAYRSKDSTIFSPNFQLSDMNVPYDTVLSYSGNDFMCIKLKDDTISAVWGDTRNGKLNIWFQRVTVTGAILSTNQVSSESIPEITIYPNPSTSKVTLECEGLIKVALLDQNGKVLSLHQNNNYSDNMVIDLSHLNSGVYLVQVTSSGGIISKKVIKQ